jgi:hypothetical protein
MDELHQAFHPATALAGRDVGSAAVPATELGHQNHGSFVDPALTDGVL